MKILYIASTGYIIYMVKGTEPFKSEYEKSHDSFLHWKFAVAPCSVIGIISYIFVEGASYGSVVSFVVDACWTTSIFLEAVAILPQLIVLQRYREVENLTSHYIFFLGSYRALYILNWVYRAYHEKHYHHDYILYFCAIVQTCLYIDFFYYYVQR